MELINKCIKIINNNKINKNNKVFLIHDIKKKELNDLKDKLGILLPNYNILIVEKKNINMLNNLKVNYKNNIILTNLKYDDLEDFKDKYYFINFSRITNYEEHLFTANFEEFDFSKLYDENKKKEYEGILWNNSKNLIVNLGDTIYVYYSDIVDGINRILLECEVIDDGYHFGENENDKCIYDEEENCLGVRLKFIKGINTKDRNKFSYEKLMSNKEYGLNILRGKQHLDKVIHKKLIDDLENVSKEECFTLNEFRDYFRPECKCTKVFPGISHKTFIKENGLYHYEIHHLIRQEYRKNDKDENIYNSTNEISLCLNCHQRIHKGKIEDRIKMVKYLYNENRKEFDEILNRIDEAKNNKLEWLLKQYVKEEKLKEYDLK